jgi:hypothetical protein
MPPSQLDCIARGGCLIVEHSDGCAWASWCLWCGVGISNEHGAGWTGADDDPVA